MQILKFALLGGLLVGTAVLAAPPSSNPIQSFTANPSTATAGQTTTLSWVVEGAKNVTLSGVSATPASSAVVAPTHTTTYTLTAQTDGDKSVSKEVTVSVTADTSIATAVIDAAHPGSAVPAGFLGFSHEWGQAQLLMGDPAIGTNPIYRQLLDNLTDSPLVMGPSDAEFPSLPLSSNGITITTTYLTVPNMVSFLQQEASSLAVVSQHHYTTFGSNVGGNPIVVLRHAVFCAGNGSPGATAAGYAQYLCESEGLGHAGSDQWGSQYYDYQQGPKRIRVGSVDGSRLQTGLGEASARTVLQRHNRDHHRRPDI